MTNSSHAPLLFLMAASAFFFFAESEKYVASPHPVPLRYRSVSEKLFSHASNNALAEKYRYCSIIRRIRATCAHGERNTFMLRIMFDECSLRIIVLNSSRLKFLFAMAAAAFFFFADSEKHVISPHSLRLH